jgi:hypothetical protein
LLREFDLMILYERDNRKLSREWIRENSDKLTRAEVEALMRELETDISKLRPQIEAMPDRF